MRMLALIIILSLQLLETSAHAQLWSDVLDPSRAINWAQAGMPAGIPKRTSICATFTSTATAAQINSAIAACPSGQVVVLGAGIYNLSTGLIFDNKRNVTLRGAGPDQTILTFTGNNTCSGLYANVCIRNGATNWTGGPGNTANWTAGYAKGTTVITLSDTTNLQIGTLMNLDQLDDSNTDNGEVWVCATAAVCSLEGNSSQRAGRLQSQTVQVTAINGNNITISPGLYMPNWKAGKTPQAWWSSDTPVTGVGIEDLSLILTNGASQYGIALYNASGCWITNIKSVNGNRSHIYLYQSKNIVVRSSYLYGTQNSVSQSYGIELFITSDSLIENNIFQRITAPMMMGLASVGNVFGYNYSIDNYYSVAAWMMPQTWQHVGGIAYNLMEGNLGVGFGADNIHGTNHFATLFRNYYTGWEAGKSAQTVAIMVQAANRFFNVVGNVLGTNTYHTKYETVPPTSTNCEKSIYGLGWGGNCGPGALPNDSLVPSTLLRWGNYDVVNAAARWQASEVPSGLPKYANPVPSIQTLPNSFYLTAKPAWYGTTTWPSIGPDVSGGALVNGHVHKIPAYSCFENTAQAAGILIFNAKNCYAVGSGGDLTPPSAPTNLSVN